MKRVSRILIALFAVLAVIVWCWLPMVLVQAAKGLSGMGDGAASEPSKLSSLGVLRILLLTGIWLVPMTAFVLMFLNTVNVLKGAVRCVAYWYSLVFLVVAMGGALFFADYYFVSPRWSRTLNLLAVVFMLVSGLWVFAFREQKEPAKPQ